MYMNTFWLDVQQNIYLRGIQNQGKKKDPHTDKETSSHILYSPKIQRKQHHNQHKIQHKRLGDCITEEVPFLVYT